MDARGAELAPVTVSQRINSVDIIRGVALLGILLINIVYLGLPHPAYHDPTAAGGATGLNLRVWEINTLFFEGTMRALFSMLFGAGVILLTGRLEKRGGGVEIADIYYRRTIWLLIFGIIHGYLLLFPMEILYDYGLMGLFLFPFRKSPPKWLILASVVLMFGGTALNTTANHRLHKLSEYALEAQAAKDLGDTLTKEQEDYLSRWEERLKADKPSQEKLDKTIKNHHKGYFGVARALVGDNTWVQSRVAYRNDPWDILSMMLLGMALFQLGVFQAKLKPWQYGLMALLGYIIGIPINLWEVATIEGGDFSVLAFSDSSRTYLIGRFFVAFGHIGVIMLFCQWGGLSLLRKSFAAVGRMALTNYVMQTVLCNLIFLGFGFGLYGKLQRYELYYVVFGIWAFQLIASPIWLKYFRFGPLEWAWRSLTYKKLQPFR
jgi:uncharacterized protein